MYLSAGFEVIDWLFALGAQQSVEIAEVVKESFAEH